MAINPEDNISKQIPAFPYDKNRKAVSIMVLPIVDPGTKEIIGYLPAGATDNGDGTATLKIDSELVLDGNVIINNIKIATDDEINANRFLLVDQDTGFLKVQLPPPTTPSGSTQVIEEAFSSMSGSVDVFFLIPNNTILTIQQLSGGSQISVSGGSKVELFEDATGTGSPLTRIKTLFVDGVSDETPVLIDFTGDGTRRILLRRTAFTGAGREIEGGWVGFTTP